MNRNLALPLSTHVAIAARQRGVTRYIVGYFLPDGRWRGLAEHDVMAQRAVAEFKRTGHKRPVLDGVTYTVQEA
jgi:hypothetical protein